MSKDQLLEVSTNLLVLTDSYQVIVLAPEQTEMVRVQRPKTTGIPEQLHKNRTFVYQKRLFHVLCLCALWYTQNFSFR